MGEDKLNNSQIDAVVTKLKNRYTTINGYLIGDIQSPDSIKELLQRSRKFQIEKLQLPVESKLKQNLINRLLISFLVCILAAILIVYSGIFDFGKLFPPMTDLASAIHANSHSNITFDWILPTIITTLILFVVNIIVLGLIVFPIAKICDTGLAKIHNDTQSAISGTQLIHEITVNINNLGMQHKGLNKIIDQRIQKAQESNDINAVNSLDSLKNDLLSHAIEHHGYYNILMKQLTN